MKRFVITLVGMLTIAAGFAKTGEDKIRVEINASKIKYDRPELYRWSTNYGELRPASDAYTQTQTVEIPVDLALLLLYDSPQARYFPIKKSCNAGENPDQVIESEIKRLSDVQEALRNLCVNLDQVKLNYGKKVTSDIQKTVIEVITDTLRDQKLKQDILKDLSKNKISKKIKRPLENIYVTHYKEYVFAKSNLQELNDLKEEMSCYSDGNKRVANFAYTLREYPNYAAVALAEQSSHQPIGAFISNDKFRFRYKKQNIKQSDFPVIEFTDSIPNPFLGDDGIDIDIANYLALRLGGYDWYWTLKEDGQSVNESYPHSVSYLRYASHPEYRVKLDDYYTQDEDYVYDSIVYDSDGKLIAVNIYNAQKFAFDYDALGENDSPIGRAIKQKAYKDNEYDIQNASAATKSYITDQLGLRKKTAAELKAEDKAASRIADAFLSHATADMKHGRNTKAAKRAKDQAGLSLLGALLVAGGNYDSDGRNWIEQIEKDWKNKLDYYTVERIDPVTYEIIHYDEDDEPLLQIVWKYVSTGPYEKKKTVDVTVL